MNGVRRSSGFTLVELLCAVTIALVLMSVALPGWQEHRFRVERVQAVQALQRAAACEAARSSISLRTDRQACLPGSSGAYRFLLVPARGGFAMGHEWRAEPRGRQRGDACGTLVLDHAGRRLTLGAGSSRVDCWRGR